MKKPSLAAVVYGCLLFAAVFLHVRALRLMPLYAYGLDGGELLPHIQRLYAEHMLTEQGFTTLLHPLDLLRALDGQYPALLHVLAVPWRRLGGAALDDFAFISHLNLLFLFTIGAFSGLIAQDWLSRLTRAAEPLDAVEAGAASLPPDQPAPAHLWPALGLVTLLLPGLYFPARIHYYDLPMTALITATGWALLTGPGLRERRRALLAGLLAGLAALIKWAAVLYLLPIGLLAWSGLILEPRWPQPRPLELGRTEVPAKGTWRPLVLHPLLALSLALALTLPLALKPDGSFHFQRQVGLSLARAGGAFGTGIGWYAGALQQGGIGLLGVIVVLGAIGRGLWWSRNASRKALTQGGYLLIKTAFLCFLPLTYLLLRVPVWDGRYLMPLLPWLVPVMGLGLVVSHARPPASASLLQPRVPLAPVLLTLAFFTQLCWLDLRPSTRELSPWQERWWQSLSHARPSALTSYRQPFATLCHAWPHPRLVLDARPLRTQGTWIWLYLLEEAGQGGSLVPWPAPTGAEGSARTDAATGTTGWDEVDGVVLNGAPSQPLPPDWDQRFERRVQWEGSEGSIELFTRRAP